MSDYELTRTKREKWERRLTDVFPHGSQKKAVEALAARLSHEESTLQRYLSEFKRGRPKALEFFFETGGAPPPVRLLEEHLERTDGYFALLMSQIRSDPSADGLFDIRLPGFGDKGAVDVAEAWLPPVRRRVEVVGGVSSRGGQVEIEKLVESITATRNQRTVCLITGPRGSGRTVLLKRLVKELEGPAAWRTEDLTEGTSVVAIDDFGGLRAEEKRALASWGALMNHRGVLLVVVDPGESLGSLRPPDIVIELGEPGDTWMEKWLTHLGALAKDKWRIDLDTKWLVDWYRDEPTALETAGTADIAAVLLRRGRASSDSGPSRSAILDAAVAHVADLLSIKGHDNSAEFMRLHGRSLVAVIAAATFESSPEPLPRERFAVLAWEAVLGTVDARNACDTLASSMGFSRLLADLVSVGFVSGRGPLEVMPRSLTPLALGTAVVNDLVELDEVLTGAVLEPSWHPALEIIAESKSAEILIESILKLPPAVLSQSIGALTRVLGVRPRNVRSELLDQAFQLCLSWWARRARRRPGMSFSLTMRPEVHRDEPTPEGRIGRLHPLVVLGRASGELSGRLGALDPEKLVEGAVLGEGLHRYLQALGSFELSTEEATLATVVGAPFQLPQETALDPSYLSRVGPKTELDCVEEGILDGDEFDTWWRVVFLPLVDGLGEGQATAILGGTAEGFDIRWWLNGQWRRADVWADAVRRLLVEGEPGSVEAFSDALVFTLLRGGEANKKACKSVWSGLAPQSGTDKSQLTLKAAREALKARGRPGVRQKIADHVAAELATRPADSRPDTDFMSWLLMEVLGSARMSLLWEAWLGSGASRMPWKAAYEAGLELSALLEWAAAPSAPERTVGEELRSKLAAGQPAFINLTADDRTPEKALDFLLDAKGVDGPSQEARLETIRFLALHGQDEQRARVLEMLRSNIEGSRALRLELAAKLPVPDCLTVAPPTKPEVGESEFWSDLWMRVYQRFGFESLSFAARADLAHAIDGTRSAEDGLWPRTRFLLRAAELVLMDPDARRRAMEHAEEDGLVFDESEMDEGTQERVRTMVRQGLGPLVLEITRKSVPYEGAGDLAAEIVSTAQLLPLVGPDGAQIQLLRLAAEAIGPQQVAERITEVVSSLPDRARSLLLAVVQGGGDPLFAECLKRSTLHMPLARVMAARLHPRAIRLLRATFEEWGFADANELDEVPAAVLYPKWLAWEPLEASEALRATEQGLSDGARRAWWTLAVRTLPPGAWRAEAAAQLLSVIE